MPCQFERLLRPPDILEPVGQEKVDPGCIGVDADSGAKTVLTFDNARPAVEQAPGTVGAAIFWSERLGPFHCPSSSSDGLAALIARKRAKCEGRSVRKAGLRKDRIRPPDRELPRRLVITERIEIGEAGPKQARNDRRVRRVVPFEH